MDLDSFQKKIDKGANLVQIYTGFIYEGPSLINEITQFQKLEIKFYLTDRPFLNFILKRIKNYFYKLCKH